MLIVWKQERRSVSGCFVVHHSPNHKEGQTEQVRIKQKEIRLTDLVKSADVAVLHKAGFEKQTWNNVDGVFALFQVTHYPLF